MKILCVTGTLLFDLLSFLEISNEIKDLNSNELLILKKLQNLYQTILKLMQK